MCSVRHAASDTFLRTYFLTDFLFLLNYHTDLEHEAARLDAAAQPQEEVTRRRALRFGHLLGSGLGLGSGSAGSGLGLGLGLGA